MACLAACARPLGGRAGGDGGAGAARARRARQGRRRQGGARAAPTAQAAGVGNATAPVNGNGGAPARDNGVFLLLVLNVGVYIADHVLKLPVVAQSMYLWHAHPQPWQWVTSLFAHGSWGHLSGNMFFLYVFGRILEEQEGSWALVFTYLLCGVCANVASVLLLGHGAGGATMVSLGASGAVFGLFTVATLAKISFNWKRLLESVILGNFVVERLWQEGAMQLGGGAMAGGAMVNHIAHIAGALAGVMLIMLLNSLPKDDGSAA